MDLLKSLKYLHVSFHSQFSKLINRAETDCRSQLVDIVDEPKV